MLLVRAALRRVDPRLAHRACWLGLLPVALPVFHTLQRGQVNALPLLCVCLALWALAHQRDFLAGMAIAGAAATKITPGFAAVYFVYQWLAHQVLAVRSGTWRPATLLGHTRPLVGFALGMVLGLWLIPALYMGPQPAAASLLAWRQTVAGGYFRPDSAGNVFGDTAGIHDTSNKNQTWYRAIVSTAALFDADALQSRDLLQPAWQRRTQWILAGIGLALTAGLLYLSQGARTPANLPRFRGTCQVHDGIDPAARTSHCLAGCSGLAGHYPRQDRLGPLLRHGLPADGDRLAPRPPAGTPARADGCRSCSHC